MKEVYLTPAGLRARAIDLAAIFGDPESRGCITTPLSVVLTEYFTVLVAEARREADISAMCLRCREGDVPIQRNGARGVWHHVSFSRWENWVECRASAIREQEETP